MNRKLAFLAVGCLAATCAAITVRSCRYESQNQTLPLSAENPPAHKSPHPSTGPGDPKLAVERDAQFRKFFESPIAFYGKVVDQNQAPIQGADIRMVANDNPGSSGTTYHKSSDSEGLFSITGIHGLTISVEASKEGYKRISPREDRTGSYRGFAYGLDQGEGIHTPMPDAPVIFVLHKSGRLEPLVLGDRRVIVPKDGTAVRLPLEPTSPNGPHFIEVQCWIDDGNRDEERHFDWGFKITVPNGGLVERKDDFAFEAPAEGYQASGEINMPKSLKGRAWADTIDRNFFIHFNDNTFARVHLNMGAFGAHYVVYSSCLNPKPGSRNLETGPGQK